MRQKPVEAIHFQDHNDVDDHDQHHGDDDDHGQRHGDKVNADC